jgi:hypothetical protein
VYRHTDHTLSLINTYLHAIHKFEQIWYRGLYSALHSHATQAREPPSPHVTRPKLFHKLEAQYHGYQFGSNDRFIRTHLQAVFRLEDMTSSQLSGDRQEAVHRIVVDQDNRPVGEVSAAAGSALDTVREGEPHSLAVDLGEDTVRAEEHRSFAAGPVEEDSLVEVGIDQGGHRILGAHHVLEEHHILGEEHRIVLEEEHRIVLGEEHRIVLGEHRIRLVARQEHWSSRPLNRSYDQWRQATT